MRSLQDRFWEKVEIKDKDECWLWKGATYRKGYGHIRAIKNDKWVMVKAHVVSYMIHNGLVSPTSKLMILHTCDNPPCVNPYHLYAGTARDNARDRVVRGRHRWGIHSKINFDLAQEIRKTTGTNKSVGILFGISATEVSLIKNNKRWKIPAQGD